MKQSRIEQLIEVICIQFLFFHTLWHLLYFERGTTLVFISFFALGVILLYSIVRHWRGLKAYGIRLDNLKPSLFATIWPLCLLVIGCLTVIMVKHKVGRWPHLYEFFTLFLWGLLQQTLIQGYFLLQYDDIVRRKWIAILLTATTFACIHIPNRDLMVITFLGGLYLSFFFYTWRNLIAAGFLHGMISLTLIVTLKSAHVMSDNYRVGPDPLGPIRKVIHASRTENYGVAEYVPSSVPGSFKHHFEQDVRPLNTPEELMTYLAVGHPVFVVLSHEDLRRFLETYGPQPIYIWKESLMWRRKFPNAKEKTARALLSFDMDRLHALYRKRMVLISNQPPHPERRFPVAPG